MERSGGKSGGCPVQEDQKNIKTGKLGLGEGGCPVNEQRGVPAVTEQYNSKANDLVFGNDIHPEQQIPLSKKRVVSTIPKGDFTPDHQPEGMTNWVYPSQQQYYNAMKRKGFNPEEKDVEVILAIHNIVNEKGWQQIKEWEEVNGCTSPKLVRFMGRPTDVSPKAYLRSLLGYTLPFDRHDWIIDSNGKEVRYVIDFYTGNENSPLPPSTQSQTQTPSNDSEVIPSRPKGEKAHIAMHLDVRPAIDTPTTLLLRLKFSAFKFFQKYSSLLPFSFPLPKSGSTKSSEEKKG